MTPEQRLLKIREWAEHHNLDCHWSVRKLRMLLGGKWRCYKCDGVGKVYKEFDEHCDPPLHTCTRCNGSGKITYKESDVGG